MYIIDEQTTTNEINTQKVKRLRLSFQFLNVQQATTSTERDIASRAAFADNRLLWRRIGFV
jgi:hypothetical protein